MKRVTIVLCLLALSSCVPPNAAVAARYNAIAPEYRAYVEADPSLSEPQKQSRRDLLEAWRLDAGVPK